MDRESRASEATWRLFRPEAIQHQRERAFGPVIEFHPLRWTTLGLLVSALVIVFAGLTRMQYQPALIARLADVPRADLQVVMDIHSRSANRIAAGETFEFFAVGEAVRYVAVVLSVERTCDGVRGCVRVYARLPHSPMRPVSGHKVIVYLEPIPVADALRATLLRH